MWIAQGRKLRDAAGDATKDAVHFDERTGAPRNPRGRTGLAGRGLLGKWGPNHAADPIVTRWGPDKDEHGERPLQMVAIKRQDTGDWAIPGGMVDDGEHLSDTLKREFAEEAGAPTDTRAPFPSPFHHHHPTRLVPHLRSTPDVWRGRRVRQGLGAREDLQGERGEAVGDGPLRVPRLRRRPAQHGQRVDGDDRVPLPLQRRPGEEDPAGRR